MPWSRSRPGPTSASHEAIPGWLPSGRRARLTAVLGPIIIVVVLVLAIPIAVFMSGAVLAAVLGHFVTSHVEAEYEGTEYVGLS
jgi:hypothetical protein